MIPPILIDDIIVEETLLLRSAFGHGLRLGHDENGFWVRNWPSHEDSFETADEAAWEFLQSFEAYEIQHPEQVYRRAAEQRLATDELEFEKDETVSVSEDGGAWVRAWVWVPNDVVSREDYANA